MRDSRRASASRRAGSYGYRAVADCGDRAQHVGEPRLSGIPHDARAPRREIDARPPRRHVWRPSHDSISQMHAPQWMPSSSSETSRFPSPVVRTNPACAAGSSQCDHSSPRLALRLGPVGHGGAPIVERIEPRGMDRLRDAEASRAAEAMRDAVDLAAPARGLGVGIAAVEAAGVLRRPCAIPVSPSGAGTAAAESTRADEARIRPNLRRAPGRVNPNRGTLRATGNAVDLDQRGCEDLRGQ